MKTRIEALRAAIRERHRTAHAFCRANPELKRSTVYLALSGKYPGNLERQAAKIEAALNSPPEGGESGAGRAGELSREEAHTVLQAAKCAHCRRLDKRGCPECNTQTAREAEALEAHLRSRGGYE